jgi:acylphosphatase
MTMTQAHILYSGIVQGVGFRYAVQNFAVPMGLKGWVRNLPDGRVEVLVEGVKDDVYKLMALVEQRFEGSIQKRDLDFSDHRAAFQDFRVAF